MEATKLTSPSSSNMAMRDMGLFSGGHRLLGNSRDGVPSRSGSAPPSMEGSFASIQNLVAQQDFTPESSYANFNSSMENFESEEQMRADPTYLAYYLANVNLNPRLPPPLVSRENRHLARHIGSFVDNRRLTSFDDSTSGSLLMPRAALPTHKEEPEDERSPRYTSDDWGEKSWFLSGQYKTSLAGRHKSLVDLIQEDFPRTPSPVYNLSCSSSHTATEGTGDQDAHANHLNESSTTAAKVESNSANAGPCSGPPSLGVHVGSLPPSGSPDDPAQSSSSADMTRNPNPGSQGGSSSEDVHLDDDSLISGVTDADINNFESQMKGFALSNLPNSDVSRTEPERKQPQYSNLPRRHSYPQGTSQPQGGHPHITSSQGMHLLYNSTDHLSHAHSMLSSVDVQPVIQTSGIPPPLYASASAYMAPGNPFYPNLQQPSSVFTPQYGIGGYALNAALMPPFIAGYPPHGAFPVPFDNSAVPSFNARSAGVSTEASSTPGLDLQHLYKFYGQLGLALQPSFTDPLFMQYYQHPSEDAYSPAGLYDPLSSRSGGIVGSQDSFASLKGPSPSAYMADQKFQYSRSGALNISSPRKVGITSPISYGSPPGMGVLMQYPTSPLASPVIPGSQVAGMSLPGRRAENFRLPPGPTRNVGVHSGWQGQRGMEKLDEQKPYSFLEELKSSKARRFELSDIAGRIVEFSADQHGSRFIQQKLESCSADEKASVFEEVLPHAPALMTDVFGNYVIQKFFEHGSPEQRKELADQLAGRILPLSLQMYGCRVIQKALEVIELDQKTQLVLELKGHVMRCVRDQNGNHVIQKCIECVPTEKIGFIISAFCGQVASLSTHPYGCRVIQRVLEHCTDEHQTQCIVDEVLQSACSLAQDQYGNYVTQHVLERGKLQERSQIISKLAGQIVQMSQHKFASNVIEKCLEHGDAAEREHLIEEIVGQTEGNDNLLIMMKDQYANYVVQKILDTSTDKQREVLLNRMRAHMHALKKYTYGKHIVSRVEQLSDEGIQDHEA